MENPYACRLVCISACNTYIATLGAESPWRSICANAMYRMWALMRVCLCRHLGGEVPVEDAFAVQVLQPSSDVQSQAEPQTPRQVHVAAQQLLQVTAVDVLRTTTSVN